MARAIIGIFIRPVMIAFLILIAIIPSLYLGQTDVVEPHEPAQSHLDVIDNVAVGALYRIGLMQVSNADVPGGDGIEWLDESALSRCISSDFTAAILATEAYARGPVRRSMELGLARALYAVTGDFPNWSFGLGQIKIATANKAIEWARSNMHSAFGPINMGDFDDSDLFEFVAAPCSAAMTVQMILDMNWHLTQTHSDAAAAYRGGESAPSLSDVFTYESLFDGVISALHDHAAVYFDEAGGAVYPFAAMSRNQVMVLPAVDEFVISGYGEGTASQEIFPFACYTAADGIALLTGNENEFNSIIGHDVQRLLSNIDFGQLDLYVIGFSPDPRAYSDGAQLLDYPAMADDPLTLSEFAYRTNYEAALTRSLALSGLPKLRDWRSLTHFQSYVAWEDWLIEKQLSCELVFGLDQPVSEIAIALGSGGDVKVEGQQ